ncbi:MAG: class I SAM-dependent methyltransferase [Planctomycetota bacterium]
MTEATHDAATSMDKMYRYTRHVYDASRKYYLLGRDGLLKQITDDVAQAGRRVRLVEVGCGTGRNLIALQRLLDKRGLGGQAQLFGVDAASVMIDTARKSVDRRNLSDKVTLTQGLAQYLSPGMLGIKDRRDEGWADLVFFSYSLSMIPPWKDSVAAALRAVGPGGAVRVVDFYDQAKLPAPFAWTLKRWLATFHVHYRPELVEHLNELRVAGDVRLDFEEVLRRYAYRAKLTRLA